MFDEVRPFAGRHPGSQPATQSGDSAVAERSHPGVISQAWQFMPLCELTEAPKAQSAFCRDSLYFGQRGFAIPLGTDTLRSIP